MVPAVRRAKGEGGGARGVLTRRLGAAAPWTRVAKHHCSGNTHAAQYASLGQAEAACTGNAECSSVYDGGCDGRAPFYMCKAGLSLGTSSSSCVYAKRESSFAHTTCSWSEASERRGVGTRSGVT